MPNRERKRVSDARSDILKRISPQESSCTPLGHEKSEYLRLNEENEKENRDEATRGGMKEMRCDMIECGRPVDEPSNIVLSF